MNPVSDGVNQRSLVSDHVDQIKADSDQVGARNPISDCVVRKKRILTEKVGMIAVGPKKNEFRPGGRLKELDLRQCGQTILGLRRCGPKSRDLDLVDQKCRFRQCEPAISGFRPCGPQKAGLRLGGPKKSSFRPCGQTKPGFRPCGPKKSRFNRITRPERREKKNQKIHQPTMRQV